LCGLSALYWELVLIRWLSVSIRIVAYYSNFVLIAAFFGLGVGALLARYRVRLQRLIFPVVSLTVMLGLILSGFFHLNPSSPDEYIWIGPPFGLLLSEHASPSVSDSLSVSIILIVVYVAVASVFVIFGQWIGNLFKSHKPLWAYSVEIFGSIIGILLFAILSFVQCSAIVWFVVGFILLLLILEKKVVDYVLAVACCVIVLLSVSPFANTFVWSPYYRIYVEPLTTVFDRESNQPVQFQEPIGYALTVNSDYHQMLLNLKRRPNEHIFLRSWRALYDFPYRDIDNLPEGPILIVGAGTGNDVSAALRNTRRPVYAVEIDPAIVQIGRQLHFDQPYNNPRVTLVVDDARSFFHNTEQKFALVVFGFLDSHTLLSSFSSVRLDNFVYTKESLEQVKRILLPGGRVEVVFASNKQWIHDRIVSLLDDVFDYKTRVASDTLGYSNGIIYANGKLRRPVPAKRARADRKLRETVPTDNWPYLYLRNAAIPNHYLIFIFIALTLGSSSLLFLPKGERSIHFPYFFLGAAFFLIETSNVVSLSLLYGSTWYVNVLVFTGILTLVLLGNLTSYLMRKPRINSYFVLLAFSIVLAIIVPTSSLLAIDSTSLRAVLAIVVFLGPVYFASLIFATLIKEEEKLFQAYGSNILGAVVGGVCEYLSLIFGLKFLLLLTLAFYFAVYVTMKKEGLVSAWQE
jgi:spermidine synthase